MNIRNSSSASGSCYLLGGAVRGTAYLDNAQSALSPLVLEDCLYHQTYIMKGSKQSGDVSIDLWILPASQMKECLKTKAILSSEETASAATISHKPTQARHLAMRILTRIALSERVAQKISCDKWKIEQSRYGKPEVVGGQADLSFSISHTDDVSVLAIANSKTIGIDFEKLNPTGMETFPLHMLSGREVSAFHDLQDSEKYQYFLKLWTLKEAYSKAVGAGVSIEFDTLDFTLAPLTMKISGGLNKSGAIFKTLQLFLNDQSYIMSLCLAA